MFLFLDQLKQNCIILSFLFICFSLVRTVSYSFVPHLNHIFKSKRLGYCGVISFYEQSESINAEQNASMPVLKSVTLIMIIAITL